MIESIAISGCAENVHTCYERQAWSNQKLTEENQSDSSNIEKQIGIRRLWQWKGRV